MPVFGQLVIGPPGAGKSSYCKGMNIFLKGLGRKVASINLDPANENVPFQPDIDISELIKLEEVMETLNLGPNGGLIYCMEYLNKNFNWLEERIKNLEKGTYLLFDCPGQVELFTNDDNFKCIIKKLESLDFRLCAVHLVDSHYCSDPFKFISVCLTSLSTMLQISLPHVNLLSKVDLIEKYGKLHFNVDYYTEVLDLSYLLNTLPDDPFTQKFKKLNSCLIDVVENYGLVQFTPLNVISKESMINVKNLVDKANGYGFGKSDEERKLSHLMSCAMGDSNFEYVKTADVREQYMNFESANVSDQKQSYLGNDLDKMNIAVPNFQI